MPPPIPTRCVVIYDGKFKRLAGKPASFNMHYEGYLKRYLDVFDKVLLIARVYEEEDTAAQHVEGPNATFLPLPLFSNELNFLLNIPRFLWVFWRTLKPGEDVVVLRIPSLVGLFAAIVCRMKKIPYAVEVAGDPADDFSAGTAAHQGWKNRLLRPIHKMAYVWPMKWLCKTAVASAYVTQTTLQKRYPPGEGRFTTHYTTLNLLPEAFAPKPRPASSFTKTPLTLVNIGMMQRLIKGQDMLIEAVSTLRKEGHDIRLILVGSGTERPLIEQLAKEAGIAHVVKFTGLLSAGEPVRDVLQSSDIFVMPSRQEGLPRAMLEAMAQGLPCIGSDVGGIPELLPKAWVFPAHDVAALTHLLRNKIKDAEALAQASSQNIHMAECYSYDKVKERRRAFYTALKKATP